MSNQRSLQETVASVIVLGFCSMAEAQQEGVNPGYLWMSAELSNRVEIHRFNIATGGIESSVLPIDPATRQAICQGDGVCHTFAIAEKTLYLGTDDSTLFAMADVHTGQVFDVGFYAGNACGSPSDKFEGGAYHAATGTVWRATTDGRLLRSNESGDVIACTTVAGAGFHPLGLAWIGDELYMTVLHDAQFGRVNNPFNAPSFEIINLQGIPGGHGFDGLAYAESTETLYMATRAGGSHLWTIDLSTSQATYVVNLGADTDYPSGAVADALAWHSGALCGNGMVEFGEACDDGNVLDSDGCDSICEIERGYACSNSPSVCGPDCNLNGLPDQVEIGDGSSEDCNSNNIPDECDEDCNGDDIPNDCDEDCQANGVSDICEILSGSAEDCNQDSIPDGCQSRDCNENGELDVCEIFSCNGEPICIDCNTNLIPDVCEPDCNENGIVDECELVGCPSCGIPACPLNDPSCQDCNGNLILDACDLIDCPNEPWCLDCDYDGMPNICEVLKCMGDPLCNDCNQNGAPDSCETNCDASDLPDACEATPALRPIPENYFNRSCSLDVCSKSGEDCAVDSDCPTGETCKASACVNDSYCIPSVDGGFPGTCYVPKNRYISFTQNPDNPRAMAHRVRIDLDGDASSVDDTKILGWVSHPFDPDYGGPAKPGEWPFTAHIENRPRYWCWPTDSRTGGPAVVHVGDCFITPGNSYLVESISLGLNEQEPTSYSNPLMLRTVETWADVEGGLVDAPSGTFSPGNGLANLADVFAIVRAFQAQVAPGQLPRFDLDPEVPNHVVNLADVLLNVIAFQGAAYPFRSPIECTALAGCFGGDLCESECPAADSCASDADCASGEVCVPWETGVPCHPLHCTCNQETMEWQCTYGCSGRCM